MAFHCDQCGLCCHLLKKVPQLATFDRGDGVCRYLKGNLCSIYEHRPTICNVEKMWPAFASVMTREEYEIALMKACAMIKHMTNTSRHPC